MPVPVTILYAALLACVGVVLQQLVGRERLRADVSLGDGADPRLLVAMRRQSSSEIVRRAWSPARRRARDRAAAIHLRLKETH